MLSKGHHCQILFSVLLIFIFNGCAFVPKNVDVDKLEPNITYPRGSLVSKFKVIFEPLFDRRVKKDRLGVARNKLMMVTTFISVSGDMKGLFDRMVKQNFAAAGLGEGPSNLIIKPELIEVFTDLSGPDHVFVRIKLAITILDSSSGVPIHHQIFRGYEVTPVTQISTLSWEEAFIGASNQISDQLYKMGAEVRLGLENGAKLEFRSAGKTQPTEGDLKYGTGWVTATGHIVTNFHVIQGSRKIILLFSNGKKVNASIVSNDQVNDLAILTVYEVNDLPPGIPINNNPARTGEKVFSIGYPHPSIMGANSKLTDGIVNAVSGLLDDPRTYQVSVPLQSGNSGGPLLNMRGEAVGIVTSKLNAIKMFEWTGDLPENVNYAVKSGYVSILINSLKPQRDEIKVLGQEGNLEDLASRLKESIVLIVAE